MKDVNLDQDVLGLYKEIMLNCKFERRQKTKTKVKEFAKALGKTENFVSSLENGRVYCSFKLFLKYLRVNGFDVSPLRHLKIKGADFEKEGYASKQLLIKKVQSLNEDQVRFLLEQTKIAEVFRIRQSQSRTEK